MHQSDPVRTLQRIGGLLRPGGWIIAQEPSAFHPRGRIRRLICSVPTGSSCTG